jgi:hypothetical protein
MRSVRLFLQRQPAGFIFANAGTLGEQALELVRKNLFAQQVDCLVGGDARCGLERKAAGEDCQPPQHGALLRGQQVVAPVEGCAQRLLSRRRGARSAREQFETVVQARADLLDR